MIKILVVARMLRAVLSKSTKEEEEVRRRKDGVALVPEMVQQKLR